MKFILYGLIIFLIVQMIRTTMRIKGNVKKWDEDADQEKPQPPVMNIPDIQEAHFEDIDELPEDEGKKPKAGGSPSSTDSTSPH